MRTYDDAAEKMAYAMATNAWKDRERGFRNMEREEVMSMIQMALRSGPAKRDRFWRRLSWEAVC
jgi:transposase